jgi:hypothetical protein
LRNHGIGALGFRDLRQAICSILIETSFHHSDHRNVIYVSNSTVPKLVRWRVILSEYQYTVEHISGKESVVADGLTRVHRAELQHVPAHHQHLYLDSSRSTTSEEFARALLQRVCVFGVPKQIRVDGGTQFNSKITVDLQTLLNYKQLTVVAYHPQAFGGAAHEGSHEAPQGPSVREAY